VVAFFWAGCRACTDEFRRLQDLEGRSEPPHILLVSSGTIPPDYPAWLAAQGITLPIVTDPNGELAIALNQWGEPEYFVLDRDGTAQFSYTTLDDIPRQVLALERLARPIT
jgi:peroxiredoxin